MYFRIYVDSRLEWRWTLYAANHKKIADSGEGYKTEIACRNGIFLVKSSTLAPVYK